MSQLNDCMLQAVSPTGASNLNDGLRLHYLANGATGALGDSLQDLEYEFLVSNGATSGQQINDMWLQILPAAVGFSGDINDMLLVFWCQGGTFAPPGIPAFNANPAGEDPWPATWEMTEEALFTFDARPYFADGGFISIWGLTGDVPVGMTITNGIVRYSPPVGDRDYSPIQVTGNNATGPAASSTAVTGNTPANVALTFQPVSQFGEIGQQVSFAVQASDATAFQWYKDGAPIAGANTFLHTTPAIAQADDNSKYFCRVTGSGGVEKDSDQAELKCMETYKNYDDGSTTNPIVQITLAAGIYTLSMSGTGLVQLSEVTASIIGLSG